MARCRIVKPEFWDDGKLASVSYQARLTYIGIWNFCDDYGVTKANSLWLKSRIYPYDDKLSIKDFNRWIQELVDLKRIIQFQACGETFYFLPNFRKHQVINRPSKTRYPEPPDNINDDSRSTHGALTDEIEIEIEVRSKKENTSPNGDGFDIFWDSYPKKRSKKAVEKIWNDLKRKKILPAIEIITQAIETQKNEREILKSKGAFCPEWKDPERWLKNGCWEDEPQTTTSDDCPGFDWSKP